MNLLEFMLAELAMRNEIYARQTEDTKPLGDDAPITGDPQEHEGHDCPKCSSPQPICREGHPGIRHSHVCYQCGTKWQHDGKGRGPVFPF